MAYHFGGKDLADVQGIDELDSCAYTVLAALFSKVEDNLLKAQRARRELTAQKKRKAFEALWTELQKVNEVESLAEENLGAVLNQFGTMGKAKFADALRRVTDNVKLRHFWNAARTGRQDGFTVACALLMAHLDLADMPGNQCVAVVRHERAIYVTGNGLWSSGKELEQDEDGGLSADTPWFSSAQACQVALDTLAGSIKEEYSADSVKFIIPTEGDMDGKFHAEMQMLEYMLDSKILPERGYIGVSKPCCTFCQSHLNGAGILFWAGHGLRGENPNSRVKPPYTSYQDPSLIAEFKKALREVPFYGLHG